jgi:lipopolysaccharide exporter
LSVARPVGWTVASYLQATGQPVRILWLELAKLVCLVGLIVTLGRVSPLWTCGAVGMAFGIHALASLWVIQRSDGVPIRRSLGCLMPALAACVPLVAGVLAARSGCVAIGGIGSLAQLLIEIAAGALGYLLGAWGLARDASSELLGRLVDALRTQKPA